MNPIFLNIRIGKTYRLVNYGEKTEFKVLRRISEDNFQVKNTLTLEDFDLADLIQFGRGPDFSIRERTTYNGFQ